jgi:glycine dehydrogenase subunit 1
MLQIDQIPGVRAPRFESPHFQEFVVDFGSTGKTVAEINGALQGRGIFGGRDLSTAFPELGQCALYCVSEVHSQADIDILVTNLKEVLGR